MSAHVLAVGTEAATPTELCGKAEFPEQNHGTKNAHLMSSCHAWSSDAEGPAVFSPSNCALCRSITYWLVDCFYHWTELNTKEQQHTPIYLLCPHICIFFCVDDYKTWLYINQVLQCIFSQILFISLVLVFSTPPLPLGLSFISVHPHGRPVSHAIRIHMLPC